MKILKNLLKKIKPRDTRIKINAFHDVRAFVSGQEYLVSNISVTGIGLVLPGSVRSPRKGDNDFVKLLINNREITVRVKVVYRTSKLAGFEVLEDQEKYKKEILRYFETELESVSVKRMDSKRLDPKFSKIGKCEWYFGDSNHELILTQRSGVISFYQLKYYDYFIEKKEGKLTLLICKDEEFDFTRHKGSSLAESTSQKISGELLDIIIRFVQYIPELSPAFKDEVTSDLNTFRK